MANGDSRLSKSAADTILDPDNKLFVSLVNAWEYADLEHRGRFAGAGPLGPLLESFDIETLVPPASLWTSAGQLAAIHRDPVDRMMIAHAHIVDLPLISADRNVHKYPIKTLW